VSDGYSDGATNAVQIPWTTSRHRRHGLSTASRRRAAGRLLGEQNLTKLSVGDQQIDVVARYTGADKYSSADALKGLLIQTPPARHAQYKSPRFQ
jgi:Cu/Ag efflux pump CusA